MTLEELKSCIEQKTLKPQMLLFEGDTKSFLVQQYIEELCSLWNLDKCSIDSLDIFKQRNLFGTACYDTTKLYVYTSTTKFSEVKKFDASLIIIAKHIDNDCKVVFPKVEPWQCAGYVYGIGNGISHKLLDYILTVCNGNLFRVKNEIRKLQIFPESQREDLLKECIKEQMFADTTDMNIFTFSKALEKKDVKTLVKVYKQLQVCDVEPLGLVTILCKSIEKAVIVKSLKNPTPQNTGLKSIKEIHAISYSYSKYTLAELVNILKLVYELDYKLKEGSIPESMIVDYILGIMLA